MRFTPTVWIALLAAALLPCASLAASLTASLDRDTIALGETATLTLKFEDVQPSGTPNFPKIDGLDIQLSGGPFIQTLIENNHSSFNESFSYSVSAQHAGEFTIPGLTASINGQQLSSAPVKLTVIKPAAGNNPDSQFGFARLVLPKKQFYAGETVVADLQLFYRQGTQLGRQPQIAGTPADGFTVGKINGENQTSAQVGNAMYNVIPAKIALTVNKTGHVQFGPVTVNMTLLIQTQNRQEDQGFDLFGMFVRRVQKDISVTTETLDAQSLPLPEDNKPANFSGAIGQFEIASSAGPNNVTVGDPVTVRLQISGHGAMDAVTLPDQTWQNFKTYPVTTKLETTDQFGFQGTKTFEQIVSPLNTDVHEIPALNFSYFDPQDGKYHTLTQAAVPLTVKPAGATPLPQIAATKNSAAENQTPQDILPIKTDLGALQQETVKPLVARPVFLAMQSLPVLAFLGAFVWRKRTDNLANNPRLRRQRAVAALVAAGMADLKKFAAANQPDEFFATLFRLLQEQLGERLDCPASAITENVVDEHPVLRTASDATRTALREQFQLCNQARYAPVRGTSELNSVAAQFEKLLGELQKTKS